MNKRNLALLISKHPLLRKLTEDKTIPNSIVARLIVEELMEQQIDPEGTDNLEKLKDVVETASVHLDDIKTYSESEIEPNDLDEILPDIVGYIDILEEAPLPKPMEWPAKKQKIAVVAKQKNYNRASFEILGVLQKWVGTEQQPGAIRKISAEIQKLRQDSRPASQNQIPNLSKALQDYLKVYIDIIKFSVEILKAANQKPDPNERKEMVKSLLEAKDITEFINIYRKLAGEQYKQQLEQTIKVIQSLAALKKKQPNLEPGDKNMENILRSEWTAKKAFMDLEKIADRIKTKMVELITGIQSDEKETGAKPPFDQMLMALRKAGSMKNKLEIVRVRFPQYMTPEYGLTTLDNLNDYKDLFMAVVKGKTTELEEAKTAQIQGTSKEARQFLIGIVAYYKLSEKESYEKIKADDEKFKKELQRIMKAADHMDSFNQPLADALRKFVEEMSKKPEEPPEEQEEKPEEERIDKDFVEGYIKYYSRFKNDFLKVKTLKDQSDIFYNFQQAVFKLTGKPADEIVGAQLAALTKTAQNIEESLNEEETFDKTSSKEDKKEILIGASVTQRHVKAVEEIMKKYQKYLEKVTDGSRELFDQFGEKDPKKVLYKFVKLLANDINDMISKMNSLIKKIDTKKPEPASQEEKPEQPGSEEQKLQEQKEKLSLREKIDMVETVYNFVVDGAGEQLLKAISEFVEQGDSPEAPAEETPTEEDPAEETPAKETETTKESMLREEEPDTTAAGGKVVKGDKRNAPASSQEDQTIGDRQARSDKEVYRNYKSIALEIEEKLETIAAFFPTARPFDSKYTMQQAQKSFLTVIKNLYTVTADIQCFIKDSNLNKQMLSDYIQQLESIKEVMKRIFGFSASQKESENQAAVNDEGENSGLPEPDGGDIENTGFPEDLPTRIKNFLGEYRGKYQRVKSVLDKGLFKEGIGEEYEELKAAFLQADKMVGYVTKDYKSFVAAASEQNISTKEVNKQVGDLLRKFVALYEELMSLYKRATDNPSIWQKMWKTITSKFNELKQSMSEIYRVLFEPLNIDLDLDPEDFKMPGQDMFGMPEQDLKRVAEIFTKKLGEEDKPEDFWSKPLTQQIDFVLDITPEPFKVKYFDAPVDKEKENWKKLLNYLEEIPVEVEDTMDFDSITKLEKSFKTDRIPARMYKILGKQPDSKTKQALGLLTYVYLKSTIVPDNMIAEKYYQKIPVKLRPNKVKFDKIMSKMSKKEKQIIINFHQNTDPGKIRKLYLFLKNQYGDAEISMSRRIQPVDLYGIFMNSEEMLELGIGKETDDSLQEQLANKLKPLIKEMLTKGK
jgi:hypothetical protein